VDRVRQKLGDVGSIGVGHHVFARLRGARPPNEVTCRFTVLRVWHADAPHRRTETRPPGKVPGHAPIHGLPTGVELKDREYFRHRLPRRCRSR
jgi:hypothetical protein